MPIPETASAFLAGHVERLRKIRPKKRIVFPEGTDARIISAAARLAHEELLEPILIGSKPADAPPGVRFVEASEKYAPLYYERRRAKGITTLEAAQTAARPLYYAALMVAAGDADGYVGGAANTTAETVRAALHCIGMQPKVTTVSSLFLVAVPDRTHGHNGIFAFADCAIVIDPTAVELADIAVATAQSVRALMNVEPSIAFLSFSTKGSAQHPKIDKVVEAMRIVHERSPDLHVDGELQADAALVEAVGQSKAPGSTVAGHANTLIFPDLASGNIGYKLVERLAGGAAYGPILQGLAKPANDLSRGCSSEDVYSVAIISALQSCMPSN